VCSVRYVYPIGKSNLVNDEPKRLVGDYLGQIIIRFNIDRVEVVPI
jgi:hypothetical protein